MPKSSPEELMVEEILCSDCEQVFYDWWDAALRLYTSLEVACENFRKELNRYRLEPTFSGEIDEEIRRARKGGGTYRT